MNKDQISRRSLLLKGGGTTWAGLTALQLAGPASVFGNADEEVIPWLDQAPPPPFPPSAVGNQLVWENLDSWFKPASNFFYVTHYGIQDNLDPSTWRVEVAGLVARPQSLTLADLKARSRREVDFTIECSGNNGFPTCSEHHANQTLVPAPAKLSSSYAWLAIYSTRQAPARDGSAQARLGQGWSVGLPVPVE